MGRRGVSKLKLKNVAIGQMREFSNKGRKGSKITIQVKRFKRTSKSSSSQSSFGTLADWTSDEIASALEGTNVNVNDFIANNGRNIRRKKRKRKKTNISYKEKRRRILQSWKDHREQIRQTYITGEVLPDDTTCCKCDKAATHRCLECGVAVYFCSTHVHEAHQECLHVPEMWQDGVYLPVAVERTTWLRSDGHFKMCDSQACKQVVVVDMYGRHHKIPVAFCSHEKPGVTLVRHKLWPSTISRTKIAFEFALMDWLEILYLECHVSCRNLSQALKLMGSKLPQQVNNIHELLTKETFGEFRFFKQQLRDMAFACPNVDKENICPACPKDCGTRIISLDAIFGLKRWKKAKDTTTTPKHGTRVFEDQHVVDEYMTRYKAKGKICNDLQECNSFQAGDKTRAKIKSTKVDETGIFGSVCRHEVPWRFFSLRQGESYGNAVFMIELLLKDVEKTPGCNLLILYDIACLLTKHLRKSDEKRELLNKIRMSVPAFHIYGHKPSCQVEYSPRRLEGFGLTDGEQTERLWAFLRNFAKCTREMTPANRIDTLTEALLHYSRNSINQIGEVLMQRFDRANNTKALAEKELAEALKNKGRQFITKGKIQQWATNEKESFTKKKPTDATKLTKEEKYVELLSKFYSYRQELVNYNGDDADHAQYLDQQVKKLETDLCKHEKNFVRWGPDNPTYQTKLGQLMVKKRMQLLNRMHGLSCERWFLLKLKTRYSDGQTMAQRIARQITAQSNRLKQSVVQYNNLASSANSKLPSRIQLQNAYNVESSVWDILQEEQHLVGNGFIPTYVKRTLIDLNHRVERCDEEVNLIKKEMTNVLHFYEDKKQILANTANEYQTETQYDIGVRSLLLKKKWAVEEKLSHLQSSFKECAGVVVVPPSTVQVTGEVVTPVEEDGEGTDNRYGHATVQSTGQSTYQESSAVQKSLTVGENNIDTAGDDRESESSSNSDTADEEQSCQDMVDDDDYDPLNALYAAVSNSYQDPLSSAESDVD